MYGDVVIARVADPAELYPDSDPTCQKNPDQDPTSEKKPDPYMTYNKKNSRKKLIWFLPNFCLIRFTFFNFSTYKSINIASKA